MTVTADDQQFPLARAALRVVRLAMKTAEEGEEDGDGPIHARKAIFF